VNNSIIIFLKVVIKNRSNLIPIQKSWTKPLNCRRNFQFYTDQCVKDDENIASENLISEKAKTFFMKNFPMSHLIDVRVGLKGDLFKNFVIRIEQFQNQIIYFHIDP
jgi:hypothetical protein